VVKCGSCCGMVDAKRLWLEAFIHSMKAAGLLWTQIHYVRSLRTLIRALTHPSIGKLLVEHWNTETTNSHNFKEITKPIRLQNAVCVLGVEFGGPVGGPNHSRLWISFPKNYGTLIQCRLTCVVSTKPPPPGLCLIEERNPK
jgi:hypothetical protein